jgi:hypothetical protein
LQKTWSAKNSRKLKKNVTGMLGYGGCSNERAWV